MKFKICEFASVTSGSTPSRSKHEEYFENGSVPWVKTMDLTNGPIVSTDEKITLVAAKTCKPYSAGTVLVAMYGGFKQIGRTGLLIDEAAINQALSAIDVNRQKCSPEYLLQYLNHNVIKWRRFAASSRKDPNITSADVKSFQVELPSLPEQKAIADLLSTWDEAIEKTERLIQAKEKRFKSLLRELISEPRNRQKVTGWKNVLLGDVCKIITSNVDKKTSPDETPVHLCNYMDVYRNYYITKGLDFMPASATASEIEKYQLRIHDVLLTKDSETPDDIANSACVLDVPENLLCGYHLALLRPKKNIFGPYLNFALHTPRIRYEFSRQANGATRFGLTMSAYNMVEVPLPPVEAQKDIAEALTASQHEINLLKQLADKYKTQKRGLMQKMLTGQWRVKPEIVNQYMEA